ncbi:16705_t:CDS:2, partial [Entrophospora sp. SA101]
MNIVGDKVRLIEYKFLTNEKHCQNYIFRRDGENTKQQPEEKATNDNNK